MPDYSKGKIYKLVSNYTKKIYIGSTCQPLHQRKGGHKCAYNMYINGKRHYQTSFDLIKWGDVDIVLLEECSVHNKMELHRKEREYIEKYNCVNKHIPTRTETEYREDYKERRRFLRKINKGKTLLEKKEYMAITKKILKTQQEKKDKQKQYYIANKNKISQQNRQRYQKKKLEKLTVALGSEI